MKDKQDKAMTCNEVVRSAMNETNTTQAMLQREMGYAGASSVSLILNGSRMSVQKFVQMLSIMGYSVMVGKDTEDGFVPEWHVK